MNSRNASFRETGFVRALLGPIVWMIGTALVLIALLVSAWLIDWVMVYKVWPEGIARLHELLRVDLERAIASGHGLLRGPEFPVEVANALYALVFNMTGIHDMAMRFADGASLSIPDTVARNTYLAHHDAIAVAMVGTQRFGVRLAMLMQVVPLVLVGYAVGVADGLGERAIRKSQGGHESSSLYHRAKYLQLGAMAVMVATSLLLPVSIDLRWMGVAGAIVLGTLARVQWMYYKKHI